MSKAFRFMVLLCVIAFFCPDNAQAQLCGQRCLADSVCLKTDTLRSVIDTLDAKVDTTRAELVLVTWNIGHFSGGKKKMSTIAQERFSEKLAEYKKFVYEKLSPDVICINELSPEFGKDSRGETRLAEDVVFDGFDNRIVGEQRSYSCNAIFSKADIKNFKTNDFKSSQAKGADIANAGNYYYLSVDLYIGAEKVKLVCVHLVPHAPKFRLKQMQELIKRFDKSDRVIMCGDWNAASKDAMDIFVQAGYTVANDGSIATYSRKMTPLDNIVVKGLNVSDVRTIETSLSDHYPLICKISLK